MREGGKNSLEKTVLNLFSEKLMGATKTTFDNFLEN